MNNGNFYHSMCLRILQRNRTNSMCIHRDLENWLTRLWRLASPKFSGLAGRLESWGRVAVQVQRQSADRISPSGKVGLSLLRSLTHWMRPTHITEGNLL